MGINRDFWAEEYVRKHESPGAREELRRILCQDPEYDDYDGFTAQGLAVFLIVRKHYTGRK